MVDKSLSEQPSAIMPGGTVKRSFIAKQRD